MPYNPIRVGEELDGYPAESHNFFGESVEKLFAALDRPAEPGASSPESTGGVMMQNATGADLSAIHSVLRIDGVAFEPDDGTASITRGVVLKGSTPNSDTESGGQFAIMQGPAKVDGVFGAVLVGETWVRIDVQNESDEHASPVSGDNEKLKTGSGGVPILWKESGTGEKWAVVLLGGITPATSAFGMLIEIIPAATLDGGTKEITPGKLADSVVVLKWSDDGTKLEEDTSAGSVEDSGLVVGVNLSATSLRGSTADPVAVRGRIETIEGERRFVCTPFDLRSLPGYAEGTASPDDNQTPYHEGGEEDFKLGGEECA